MLSSCEGRVEGGYYSDPALGCQAFHICVRVGEAELAKYSFLCPNGSLFHQTYFVCDFWFNVDCSQAEAQYALNDAVAAEREANIGAVAPGDVLGEEMLLCSDSLSLYLSLCCAGHHDGQGRCTAQQ